MAIVADREIPARQWTMTLQFDTLALSGQERKEKVKEKQSELEMLLQHKVYGLSLARLLTSV